MAKTVWAALAVMLLGGGLWINDLAQPKEAALPPGVSSFADSAAGGASGPTARTAPVTSPAPATFRFGASYLGGFFLGWVSRRFIKLSLLLAGGAMALVAIGKKLGWIDLDWASIEGQIQQAISWTHHEAGALKQFLTGIFPSAAAAGVGAFLGFRRK
ncbi:MAG: FUN14 domain-containing protein [Limisphaerales bacterium]